MANNRLPLRPPTPTTGGSPWLHKPYGVQGPQAGDEEYYDPRFYGGGRQRVDEQGNIIIGSSVANEDARRFRALAAGGDEAVKLGPLQRQSRSLQWDALSRLQAAARGEAPSRAEAMSQIGQAQALRSSMSGVAGARGLGGSIAAMRSAQMGAADRMLQANQSAMAMRADEMARARSAFADAASRVRGQDIDVATLDARLAAQQRELEAQRERYYEALARDTLDAERAARAEAMRQDAQAAFDARQRRFARSQQRWQHAMDAASAAAAMAGSALLLSDENAKHDIRPLSGVRRLFAR